MRRNSLLPSETPSWLKSRRHRTMIESELNQLSLPEQNPSLKTHFMQSASIVRSFIEDTLMDRIQQEMNKNELKKIVDQTMNQCVNLLHNQSWQIDPNGPFTQRQKEAQIKPDHEPQAIPFDPILGFQKHKIYKTSKTDTQTCFQFSRLKISSLPNEIKPIPFKSGSKNSINSHRTISSKLNSTLNNDFPKLIPLKLDNNPNTPEGSYRRNLVDFLRERKINAEINLGYKMKYFDQKQNHGLKIIQEFQKPSSLIISSKNEGVLGQNLVKLPLISVKQEVGTDYDGGFIPLKKVSNAKKSVQILKTICKVKNSMDQTMKPANIIKKLQTIKIRASMNPADLSNSLSLSARMSVSQDFKSIIENKLHTNRLRFREMDQNQPTPVYEVPT